MPRNNLSVARQVKVSVPKRMLQTILDRVVKKYGPTVRTETSLVFVSPRTMVEINIKYRGKSRATDVLSFKGPQVSRMSKVPLSPRPLGEIFIAPKVAAVTARRLGHSLSHEIGLLFLHGLLHTLGFDHASRSKRLRMQRAENYVIKGQGILGRTQLD